MPSEFLACPDCGPEEPLTLYSKCVHVHLATVLSSGELDWQPFDSDSCMGDFDGDLQPPRHWLQCSGCGGEWPVELNTAQDAVTVGTLHCRECEQIILDTRRRSFCSEGCSKSWLRRFHAQLNKARYHTDKRAEKG